METSRVSPTDATAALRSFARRYREEVAGRDDETPEMVEALWHRPGPDGRTVVDITVDTVRSLALLDRALEQVVVSDGPVLHAAVIDRESRTFDTAAHGPLEAVLEELDHVTAVASARVERVPAGDWYRSATIAGGGTVTALDVVREAVATGADNLREVRDAMAAGRQT